MSADLPFSESVVRFLEYIRQWQKKVRRERIGGLHAKACHGLAASSRASYSHDVGTYQGAVSYALTRPRA